MRFQSASTKNVDAYRAGYELGERLRTSGPEVILLFASISYEQSFVELQQGLTDGLGSTRVRIFGGTGDGIYETAGAAHYGVCALGLASGGAITTSVALVTGVAEDSFGAAQTCARRALASLDGAPPSLALVLADGAMADGSRLVAGLTSVLDVPLFGGLTGDDRKFSKSRLLVDGEEARDAVSVLLLSGPLPFVLHAASGWTPVGAAAHVDAATGSTVRTIGGLTAQGFLKEQLGKPLGEVDLGTAAHATYAPGGGHFALRSPSRMNADGSINTFGSIETGTEVRVCTATRSELLGAIPSLLEEALRGGGKPVAALVMSCAGRKWLLDDTGDEELRRVFDALGAKLPLVGFPSFGEISPLRRADGTYTPSLFHNVTFAACLFLESK
jgi:hypothetical protein